MSISGWYGIRFSWHKVLRLWAQIMFYTALCFLMQHGAHALGWLSSEPIFFEKRWFANSYLALMFVMPFVNAGLMALAAEPRRLWTAWALYAGAMSLHAMPDMYSITALWAPGWGSHTVSNLLFIYVTMRVFRLAWPSWLTPRRVTAGCCALLFVLLLAVTHRGVLASASKGTTLELISWHIMDKYGYTHPVIWATAVAMFMAFRQLRIPSWLGRVATFLGPSMFGIYLIHFSSLIKLFCSSPETWLKVRFPVLPDSVVILLCALFCFAVCLVIDLVRRAGLLVIKKMVVRYRRG